jgi:hypothetical protein
MVATMIEETFAISKTKKWKSRIFKAQVCQKFEVPLCAADGSLSGRIKVTSKVGKK